MENPLFVWLLVSLALMILPLPLIMAERTMDLGMRIFWLGTATFCSWSMVVGLMLFIAVATL